MASATATATATATRALASSRTASLQPVATATRKSVSLPLIPLPPKISSPTRHPRTASHGSRSLTVVKLCGTLLPWPQKKHQLKLPQNFLKLLKPYKKRQWDKLEDKYAVTSLAFAALIALYGSAGMISAIDRLPLVPGLLELVGIGYTGELACQMLSESNLMPKDANFEENERVFQAIMGPEHPGRVRCKGIGVTPNNFFPQSSTSTGCNSNGPSKNISTIERMPRIDGDISELKPGMS